MVLTLLASALAAPPGTVLVSPEAADVPDLFLQQHPELGPLRCEALVVDVVLLCFKLQTGASRRYVTEADLLSWDTTPEQLRTAARASLTENPWVANEVPDTGRYFVAQGPNAAAVLLHPEWLAHVGPEPLVALPARGVVVAWKPGDEELDKVVAVGARRMFEELDHPVTAVIIQKTAEDGWTRWGEAKPR